MNGLLSTLLNNLNFSDLSGQREIIMTNLIPILVGGRHVSSTVDHHHLYFQIKVAWMVFPVCWSLFNVPPVASFVEWLGPDSLFFALSSAIVNKSFCSVSCVNVHLFRQTIGICGIKPALHIVIYQSPNKYKDMALNQHCVCFFISHQTYFDKLSK